MESKKSKRFFNTICKLIIKKNTLEIYWRHIQNCIQRTVWYNFQHKYNITTMKGHHTYKMTKHGRQWREYMRKSFSILYGR